MLPSIIAYTEGKICISEVIALCAFLAGKRSPESSMFPEPGRTWRVSKSPESTA